MITIQEYRHEHAPFFDNLNRTWIEKYFTVEPRDEYILTNPEEAILKPGGAILIAVYENQIAKTDCKACF